MFRSRTKVASRPGKTALWFLRVWESSSRFLCLGLQAVGGFRFGGLGFDMCLGLFASQLSYNSHEEVPTLAAVETGV